MNYKIIFRLLAFILSALTVAFLLCLTVAIVHTEGTTEAFLAFSASAGVSAILGLLFLSLSRGASTKFFRKEALSVIGVGWILATLVGAIPFIILLPDYTIADGIFESASGLTTTGASVLSNLEDMPRSLIFWRALSQWMGGLGVVVFFVAILSFLGAGGKILFSNESSGRSADIEQGRVRKGVLQIFYVYLTLSVSCLLSLRVCGMNWYDAACHAFSTVSTGGFSTRSASIEAFNSPLLEWVLVIFMALGGTNFFFFVLLGGRNWSQARKMTEVSAYYVLLSIMSFLLCVYIYAEGFTSSILEAARFAAFQVVSIATTTGFATDDFNKWPLFTKMALLSLMIVGGCSASTAGGMKVIRLVVAWKVCKQSIERAFRTHVVRSVRINDKPLDDETRDNIIVYIVLLGMILLFSFPFFALFERGHSLEGAVSAVIAALFNIGPAFAEFGPTSNFVEVSSIGKIYLSLLMIMGRLELFAVLVLFAPSLWKKFS